MTTNVSRRKRRPVAMGVVKDIPTRSRNGEWTPMAEQWKASPGEKFGYSDAAPSQASYLKGRYGVETQTRNTHFIDDDGEFVSNDDAYKVDNDGNYLLNDKGKRIKRDDVTQVCDLYVVYDPATAQANIDAANAAKVKAAAKKAKASK